MAPAKHKVTTVNTGYGLRLRRCRRRSVGACSGLGVGWCPAESYPTLAVVPGSAAAYLAAGEPDWPPDDRDSPTSVLSDSYPENRQARVGHPHLGPPGTLGSLAPNVDGRCPVGKR